MSDIPSGLDLLLIAFDARIERIEERLGLTDPLPEELALGEWLEATE